MLTKSWIFIFLFSTIISYFFFKNKYYKHHQFVIYSYLLEEFTIIFLVFFTGKQNDFILLFIQIGISFFESIILILIKNIMEIKFLTPFKVCYLVGLINFIISFIILIILSRTKCKSYLDFCKEGENIFDTYFFFNSDYIFILIFCFLISFLTGITKWLINFVLNFLSSFIY